jgi:hypothetical protein
MSQVYTRMHSFTVIPTSHQSSKSIMSYDATCMSALTMDSSFPRTRRKQCSKEDIPKVKSKQNGKNEQANHANNILAQKKLAHKKLALKIKELQEKVRLAKMLEAFHEPPMCNSDDAMSFELPDEDSSRASRGSKLERSVRRPSDESDCWSQYAGTSVASFDPDFYKRHRDAPPMFEENFEDFANSKRSGKLSSKSRSSRTRRNSRSRRRPTSVTNILESAQKELEVGFPTTSEGLLVGFPDAST